MNKLLNIHLILVLALILLIQSCSSINKKTGLIPFGQPDIDRIRKEVWRYEERGKVCGAPLVDNGKVFFGQRGGTPNVYCVDEKTGNLIWKKRFGHVWASANCIDGKLVLFGNWEGLLLSSPGNAFTLCLDAKTGEFEYKLSFGGLSGPAIGNNLVFSASSTDPYFKAWDLETGKIR